MAQRTKTVEYVWETGTALRSTVTALAGTNFYTPAAITAYLPETDATRTIRSVDLIVTAIDAETTTARRVDGIRMGIQIDAVAWSDLDLTGTGSSNTGDPYSVCFSRDVTSYFVTNFTGSSHSVGARVEFETDVASNVNCITMKLRITYEYNDTSATHVKTVRIPFEGITGFLPTTANSNFRGSTGAPQIPNLDAFLPESTGRTYRRMWFEINATTAGAATTDFNMNLSVDGATTSARATMEMGLNGSTNYYDIWIPGGGDGTGYFTTNATHDFQAWSSLANRFERCSVTLCVTYTYSKVTSGTVLNSLIVPIPHSEERTHGSATGDKDRFTVDVWIEEPGTITLVQSALFLTCFQGAGASLDVRVNSQGSTSSVYTFTNLTHSGTHPLQDRIDVAHGGTAVTLARGKNTLTVDVFSGSTTLALSGLTGYFILNYTSGVHANGEGVHNHTTWWSIADHMSGLIAGSSNRSVATTGQRTPIIPEAAAFFTAWGLELRADLTGNVNSTVLQANAEILSGELAGDGWLPLTLSMATDGEYGYGFHMLCPHYQVWDRWINDPLALMDFETARVWRFHCAFTVRTGAWHVLTYHAITFSIAGTVSGSAGGTVNIKGHRVDTGERVGTTNRTGNGSYAVTVYDNTTLHFAEARESGTLLMRSDDDYPT